MSLFYVLARVVKDVSNLAVFNTPPLTLFFFARHALANARTTLYYSFTIMSMNVFVGIPPVATL